MSEIRSAWLNTSDLLGSDDSSSTRVTTGYRYWVDGGDIYMFVGVSDGICEAALRTCLS